MRRVDCFLHDSENAHCSIYCESKSSAKLLKEIMEFAAHGLPRTAKIFKLEKYSKSSLKHKIELYYKDNLEAEVYSAKLYECFSVRSGWLRKIGRRIKFIYTEDGMKSVQDYTMVAKSAFPKFKK